MRPISRKWKPRGACRCATTAESAHGRNLGGAAALRRRHAPCGARLATARVPRWPHVPEHGDQVQEGVATHGLRRDLQTVAAVDRINGQRALLEYHQRGLVDKRDPAHALSNEGGSRRQLHCDAEARAPAEHDRAWQSDGGWLRRGCCAPPAGRHKDVFKTTWVDELWYIRWHLPSHVASWEHRRFMLFCLLRCRKDVRQYDFERRMGEGTFTFCMHVCGCRLVGSR